MHTNIFFFRNSSTIKTCCALKIFDFKIPFNNILMQLCLDIIFFKINELRTFLLLVWHNLLWHGNTYLLLCYSVLKYFYGFKMKLNLEDKWGEGKWSTNKSDRLNRSVIPKPQTPTSVTSFMNYPYFGNRCGLFFNELPQAGNRKIHETLIKTIYYLLTFVCIIMQRNTKRIILANFFTWEANCCSLKVKQISFFFFILNSHSLQKKNHEGLYAIYGSFPTHINSNSYE